MIKDKKNNIMSQATIEHCMYKKSSLYVILCIISTDEDPSLRIERFAMINLRGVSTS